MDARGAHQGKHNVRAPIGAGSKNDGQHRGATWQRRMFLRAMRFRNAQPKGWQIAHLVVRMTRTTGTPP